MAYIVVGVRRRQLSDRHVRMRRERPLPLMIGVASVVVGVVLLIQAGAPRDLIALEAAMAVGLGSSLLVTLAWKISIHVAVVAGAIVILLLVLGPAAIALVPAIALVAWARVVLRDHTVGQTVAGGILGAAVAAIVFSMLRG
jgi:membrane-associated phospholipid phosphatase